MCTCVLLLFIFISIIASKNIINKNGPVRTSALIENILKCSHMAQKSTKTLVEKSLCLDISQLDKKLLYCIYDSSNNPEEKRGLLSLFNGVNKVLISYSFFVSTHAIDLEITLSDGTTNYQFIDIEAVKINYGTRPFFVCSQCDRRAKKLYLTTKYKFFYCRKCQNLIHESTRIKSTAFHGLYYSLFRYRKAWEYYNRLKMIAYNGKQTRRARITLRLGHMADKNKELIMKYLNSQRI